MADALTRRPHLDPGDERRGGHAPWAPHSGAPATAEPATEAEAEALRRAFALLPPRCQRLLGILVVQNPPSYKEISARLSMPIGSIGPTRGRCLEHLRRILTELSAGV